MILTAKKLAWEKFLAELNSQTSMSRVWKFFKAMRGTAPSSAIPFSNQNDEPQDAEQCAEMLAQHNKERFTSTTNLSREQLEIIRQATQSPNDSDYNQPFTQHELSGALNVVKCKSSMGGDNFHNDFLTHMPKEIRCLIYISADTMQAAKTAMQESISTIAEWCQSWGQEINPSKSAMIYFTRKRIQP